MGSLANLVPSDAAARACAALEEVADDGLLPYLLPYVLEIHGPGSRASVMRDPDTRAARAKKRSTGVFYTPPDVAEYMVRTALLDHSLPHSGFRCLDPACGTGVFLRAVLAYAAKDQTDLFLFAATSLYGVDISPHAVEAACFVLLHDVMKRSGPGKVPPWSIWHSLRLNIAIADSTSLIQGGQQESVLDADRNRIREDLISGRIPVAPESNCLGSLDRGGPLFGQGMPLHKLFPEVAEGFEFLVCNPPYAPIGLSGGQGLLSAEYECLASGARPNDDLYPLFVEMAWRLTRPGSSAAALVLPLSIAYHRGHQYVACRRAMRNKGGILRFAFFDREPHALFGEDVKTRNAILFRRETTDDPPRGTRAIVFTTRLQKWTSRSRKRLFGSIAFAALSSPDLCAGVPKVAGVDEACALSILMRRTHRLADIWLAADSCLPVEAFNESQEPLVYVAGTAYNFLNVFRPHEHDFGHKDTMSQSAVARLRFSDEETAQMVFAILSSRIVFWWWHVHGDGFHVPRRFLEEVPFDNGSFTREQRKHLSTMGASLWPQLQLHRVVSVNGGRHTIAYRPVACDEAREAIDRILVSVAGIQESFSEVLGRFVRDVVVVDDNDDRRAQLWSRGLRSGAGV
jgi:hypothetical protein